MRGESVTRARGDPFLRSSSGGLGVMERATGPGLASMMSRSAMILVPAAETKKF